MAFLVASLLGWQGTRPLSSRLVNFKHILLIPEAVVVNTVLETFCTFALRLVEENPPRIDIITLSSTDALDIVVGKEETNVT